MSIQYQAVQWNRQKRIYDSVLVGGVAAYLLVFGLVTEGLFPYVTEEILLLRAFGTCAFLLLHVILCLGPLCRLNPKFLPLLYNRRHAGVTLFLLALIHAVLAVTTYHAGGDANPILSIFTAGKFGGTAGSVPFQAFGFMALVILFLMAATSHDFWLTNLTAPVWKALHMLVYAAYAPPAGRNGWMRRQHRLAKLTVMWTPARWRTFPKTGRESSHLPESGWPSSSMMEKSPPSPTCASIKTGRSAKGKSSPDASPAPGTATSTSRKRGPRHRPLLNACQPLTCASKMAGFGYTPGPTRRERKRNRPSLNHEG